MGHPDHPVYSVQTSDVRQLRVLSPEPLCHFYVELWRIGTVESSESLSTNLIDVILLPLIEGHSLPRYLDFSPDGRLVAASNGATVLYDIRTRENLWRIVPKETVGKTKVGIVPTLALSPYGKSLATATWSGVYLWQ